MMRVFYLIAAFLLMRLCWGAGMETSELQAKIDRAAAAGGGRVVVSAGRHLVGQLDLRSNVELHLEKGAVLEGKVGLEHYRVTELPYSEGTWSAVVAAIGVTNVSITGEGEIFGNGTAWPQPEDYGGNQEGRRPRGVFFADCKGIRLSDFRLRDAACWGVVFKCCEDVDVRRLTIDTHANANNDGIDLEAKNVIIADCDIDAGDDAVCLKSNTPDFIVENVLVTNVTARSHCNALKLGTASHGTMRNILFVDCRTEAPRRDFIDRRFGRNRRWYEEDPGRVAKYPGAVFGEASGSSSIVVENVDGGTVENVAYRNIAACGSRTPIFIRAGTRSGRSCGTPPSNQYIFRNITLENITGEAMSAVASSVTGVSGCRIGNVTLRNIRIVTRGRGDNAVERTRPVPEVAGKYPDAHMFDCMLPAYGLYVRHVDDLSLENVTFALRDGDTDRREMIVRDDVRSVPSFTMRIDDNHSVRDWERVADIFESCGVKVSFAIISAGLSEEQGACLKRLSERGHVIMDHTPNHTFYQATYHDRVAFDRVKTQPFVAGVDEKEMKLRFHCEADDSHPMNRRVCVRIAANTLTCAEKKRIPSMCSFIRIPGRAEIFGLQHKGESFELRDFWRRPLAEKIDLEESEVLLFDQAALQPCDDVLRELAGVTRERFDHFGLPRPTIWVRPGGWDAGVSWERLERVYGREFCYIGADSSVNATRGSSRWSTGYDAMYFFDQGADITPELLVGQIEEKLAKGQYHVTLSHMWDRKLPGRKAEWFAKTERFAQLLVDRKIPTLTMPETLNARFLALGKSVYPASTEGRIIVYATFYSGEKGSPILAAFDKDGTVVGTADAGSNQGFDILPEGSGLLVHRKGRCVVEPLPF